MNTNKNDFLEYKNVLRKDLNYKGNKINIKKYNKSNKNKRINIQMNIYIAIVIFFNLIISNNNMNDYKFLNISLKIRGTGDQKVLSDDFNRNNRDNLPNIIYINENQIFSITNK